MPIEFTLIFCDHLSFQLNAAMKLFFTLLLSLLFTISAFAEQARVAVASNFIAPMKALINKFEANSEHSIKASYGSSGKLFAQISHGAPFDLFLSADQQKPTALVSSGLATRESQFTYAQGSLVLWSKQSFSAQSITEVLASHNYDRLAFANPKLAPYGIAAKSVLTRLSLVEPTKKKWIMGENISQVYSFVAYGSVDLGFLAKSQLINHKIDGKIWQIPRSLYPPINQDAVLLKKSVNNEAALAFWNFLQTKEAKFIIHAYGYESF